MTIPRAYTLHIAVHEFILKLILYTKRLGLIRDLISMKLFPYNNKNHLHQFLAQELKENIQKLLLIHQKEYDMKSKSRRANFHLQQQMSSSTVPSLVGPP